MCAGVVLVGAGCSAGNGAWPGRPTPIDGKPRPPIARGPDDDLFLSKLRGDHPGPHPPKVYWTAVPAWEPVKSLAGASIGRRTTGVVAVKLLRLTSARDKWPDLCVYEELTLRQDPLSAAAGSEEPAAFGPPRVERVVVRAEVDCAVYDAAR